MADDSPQPPPRPAWWHMLLGVPALVVIIANIAAAAGLGALLLLLVDLQVQHLVLERAGCLGNVAFELSFELAGVLLLVALAVVLVALFRRSRPASWLTRHPMLLVCGILLALDALVQPFASPGPSPMAGAVSLAFGAVLWLLVLAWLAKLTYAISKFGLRLIAGSPFAAGACCAIGAIALTSDVLVLAALVQVGSATAGPSAEAAAHRQELVSTFSASGGGSSGEGGDDAASCIERVQSSSDCELHRTVVEAVLRRGRRENGNLDDDDIRQDALLRVCMLRPPAQDPCTMYVRAVKNRATDRFRQSLGRARCLLRIPEACPVPNADEDIDRRQRDEALNGLVCQLSSDDRDLVLGRAGGESYRDLAARLGTTPDAARVRFNRAVARLQTMIAKQCPVLGEYPR